MRHLLNSITHPIVCAKCAEEDADQSLRDRAHLDVGFTDRGIQVWCRRHDVNVVHVDFADQRLEADFRCLEPKTEH